MKVKWLVLPGVAALILAYEKIDKKKLDWILRNLSQILKNKNFLAFLAFLKKQLTWSTFLHILPHLLHLAPLMAPSYAKKTFQALAHKKVGTLIYAFLKNRKYFRMK